MLQRETEMDLAGILWQDLRYNCGSPKSAVHSEPEQFNIQCIYLLYKLLSYIYISSAHFWFDIKAYIKVLEASAVAKDGSMVLLFFFF